MKKRTFLKLSSTLLAAPLFTSMKSWAKPNTELKNWAGNLTYSTNKLYEATSVTELQNFVKKTSRLKVLGSRHCFSDIADSTKQLVSLSGMNQAYLDEQNRTVSVDAGMNYGQLSPYLHQRGFALLNLASLPHISVVGACATATHGSGFGLGNLATSVVGMEFITAKGELVTLEKDKDGDKFNGAVVHLGGLGVVTKLVLDVRSTFNIQQYVYENLPITRLADHFEDIMGSAYSVSLFTNWQSDYIQEIWVKAKEGNDYKPLPDLFGAKAATVNLHPIPELSAENCTEQMGVSGPWFERLPHFKMGFTPSSGDELQSEFFIPRRNAVEAIMAISRIGDQLGPYLHTSEIRAVDADDFWMSPCYQQDSVAIHFTWKSDGLAGTNALALVEKELAPFNPRPHWGKIFTTTHQQLKDRYPMLPEFQKLLLDYDPKGKFHNRYLEKHIFGW